MLIVFVPESACSSSLFYQTGLLVSCYSPQTLIWSQIIGAILISLFCAVQKFILEFPKTHKQGHAMLSIIVLRVSFNWFLPSSKEKKKALVGWKLVFFSVVKREEEPILWIRLNSLGWKWNTVFTWYCMQGFCTYSNQNEVAKMIFSIQRFLSRGYRVKHSCDSSLAWNKEKVEQTDKFMTKKCGKYFKLKEWFTWAREGEELVPASVLTHACFAWKKFYSSAPFMKTATPQKKRKHGSKHTEVH